MIDKCVGANLVGMYTFCRGILAFYPLFFLNIWQYAHILKLYKFVPLFRNLILLKSSFNEKLAWFKIELCPIKLKKKKKLHGT